MPQQIDFKVIKENASKDGIPLEQIAIFYQNLTEDEIAVMEEFGLITHRGEDTIIARFQKDGNALFPDKATGVHYLGA